jgi:hypothetical protein
VFLSPTNEEAFPVPGEPPVTLRFGTAFAFDGVTALIGMPDFGGDFQQGIGRVALFTRVAPGQWTRTGTIDSPVQQRGTLFGTRIAFERDLALIGTPTRVFLFQRAHETWQLVKEIAAPAGEMLDGGLAVERASLLVAGSASGKPGVVHVLARKHGAWRIVQDLHAFHGGENDQFGSSLATSHGLLVAGAPGYQAGQGAAFVYLHLGAFYLPFDRLLASDRQAGDAFGTAVATDGQLIAVGAPLANQRPTNGACFGDIAGEAYVFVTRRLHWVQRDVVAPPDSQCAFAFGAALTIERGFLAVSSDASFPFVPGGTFVFTRPQGQYVPTYLAAIEEVNIQPVASHRGTLLVSAPVDRFFSTGLVEAFELEP